MSNLRDIFTVPRTLMCCPMSGREEMLRVACGSIPDDVRDRTLLNTGSMAVMDIAADPEPARFSDLGALCGRLIRMAGRSSRFHGLLLLNIGELLDGSAANASRLRALGELLALPDGLASECHTLLYGPERERELLDAADLLDHDGCLRVACYEPEAARTVQELLDASGMTATALAKRMITKALKEMAECRRFDADRFLHSLGAEDGRLTDTAVKRCLDDPYSYINRVKRTEALRGEHREVRRIGF